MTIAISEAMCSRKVFADYVPAATAVDFDAFGFVDRTGTFWISTTYLLTVIFGLDEYTCNTADLFYKRWWVNLKPSSTSSPIVLQSARVS